MKCEKMLKGEIVDRCQTWDKCGGELEYLMSGMNYDEEGKAKLPLVVMLYKCSRCGDVTVKL